MSATRKPNRGVGDLSRPRWFVYALISAFFIGGTYPLYWSFVIGSSEKSALTSTWPPLLPGGQFWANAQEVFATVDFWKALANSIINPTLQVALSQLQSAKYVDYSIVLNGAVLATLPLLILFVLAGRQLVSGIMAGAVKG